MFNECHSEMVHVSNGLNIILTTHSYPLNNIVIVTLNQLHSSPFSFQSVDYYLMTLFQIYKQTFTILFSLKEISSSNVFMALNCTCKKMFLFNNILEKDIYYMSCLMPTLAVFQLYLAWTNSIINLRHHYKGHVKI